MSRISYLSVARVADKAVLASSFSNNISSRERSEIENAFFDFLQTESGVLSGGVRKYKQVSAVGGKLFIMADQSKTCVYAACVNDPMYPERAAWQLVDEFSQMIQANASELDTAPIESLSRVFKKQMRDLMAKYETPANVDKTAQVKEKVDQVQGVMQDNVKRILDTHTNLEGLEEKTDTMSRQANQFLKQSVDLRRQMQLRNLKLKICLGIVIALIFLFIIVKIFK
jgi:uncharacterized Zn finger protein